MCGRFDFDIEKSSALKEIWEQLPQNLAVQTGEIFPTHRVPVLISSPKGEKTTTPHTITAMYWGFPHFQGTGTIINARAETVLEKSMFRDSVLLRRCPVPCSGFYEWRKSFGVGQKTKYRFNWPEAPLLYLAGIYKNFPELGEENPRFTLLTIEANPWVEDFHHRMPVVLRKEELGLWLTGDNFTQLFDRSDLELKATPVEFPAQLSLFGEE